MGLEAGHTLAWESGERTSLADHERHGVEWAAMHEQIHPHPIPWRTDISCSLAAGVAILRFLIVCSFEFVFPVRVRVVVSVVVVLLVWNCCRRVNRDRSCTAAASASGVVGVESQREGKGIDTDTAATLVDGVINRCANCSIRTPLVMCM